MIPGWRLAALVVLGAAVAWVAGILLLGAVVAPAVFAHAPPRGMDYDRLTAGAVFGDVLAGWRGAVQICWAALSIGMLGATLLAWGARRRGLGVAALALWLAVAVAHLVAQAGIGEAARALETIRAGGPDAPALRQRFDAELHPRSTRLLGIEALLVSATGLVAAWVLVRREAPAQPDQAAR